MLRIGCNMLKMLKIGYFNISSMLQGDLCEFFVQLRFKTCCYGQFYICSYLVAEDFAFSKISLATIFSLFSISHVNFKVISVKFLLNCVAKHVFVVSFSHLHHWLMYILHLSKISVIAICSKCSELAVW